MQGNHKDMQRQLGVVRVVFLACSADLLGFCIFGDLRKGDLRKAGDAGNHKDMQRRLHVVRVVSLARLAELAWDWHTQLITEALYRLA